MTRWYRDEPGAKGRPRLKRWVWICLLMAFGIFLIAETVGLLVLASRYDK